MENKLLQDLTDILSEAHKKYTQDAPKCTFEEYVLPIVGMSLALQYTPEEITLGMRDVKVRSLIKFYISDDGVKH